MVPEEPVPPPPLPPEQHTKPPSSPAIDDATLAAVLADTPCAELAWSAGEDGRFLLSGRIPSEAARIGLIARIEAIPGVSGVEDGSAIHPAPDCEATHRAPAVIGAVRLSPPLILLNRPDGIYSGARDVFVATVESHAATDLYAYVDYFHEDGSVYHLLPEPLAANNLLAAGGTVRVGHDAASAGPNERVWRLSEPYGLGRVVAIVSEQPLYDGVRAIGEPAEAYQAFLSEALPKAAWAGRVALGDVLIKTGPGS
jgi:hypothetical protein